MSITQRRTLTFTVLEEDAQQFARRCAVYGTTPEKALSSFVGDLIDGADAAGTEERISAERYFSQRHYDGKDDETFLRWAIRHGCLDEVAEAVENVNEAAGCIADEVLSRTGLVTNQADLEEIAGPFMTSYERYSDDLKARHIHPQSPTDAANSVWRYLDDLYGRTQARRLYSTIFDALRDYEGDGQE